MTTTITNAEEPEPKKKEKREIKLQKLNSYQKTYLCSFPTSTSTSTSTSVVTGIIGRRPVHQQLRRFHLLKKHRLAELTADGGLLKAKGRPLGDEVEVRVVAEAHDVRGHRGQRRLTFL